MKKYDILVAKLYACCGNQEEFPREPITIDTNKMSELLEGVFIEAGLLEIKEWSPAICPSCGYELSESVGDGYYRHPTFLERCPNPDCGQRLKWEE